VYVSLMLQIASALNKINELEVEIARLQKTTAKKADYLALLEEVRADKVGPARCHHI
jgi:hypothetical protein